MIATPQPMADILTTEAKKETSIGWHDSLLSLLRSGRTFSSDDEAASVNLIVVDNAKPHRSLSDSQNTAATTPTPSLNDSLGDFRFLLEDLLEGSDDEADARYWGRACDDFHNSYPVPSTRRNKRRDSQHHNNRHHRRNSSDPEIGRGISLDDMLREEDAGRPQTNCVIPKRPERQVSIDEHTLEDVLCKAAVQL